MFSVDEKRLIANLVQQILRDTNHPELPAAEIQFHLHVDGAESWSWADIRNNGAVKNPGVNPWNEAQARRAAPARVHGRVRQQGRPRHRVVRVSGIYAGTECVWTNY